MMAKFCCGETCIQSGKFYEWPTKVRCTVMQKKE
jgi:hypothetical protein